MMTHEEHNAATLSASDKELSGKPLGVCCDVCKKVTDVEVELLGCREGEHPFWSSRLVSAWGGVIVAVVGRCPRCQHFCVVEFTLAQYLAKFAASTK